MAKVTVTATRTLDIPDEDLQDFLDDQDAQMDSITENAPDGEDFTLEAKVQE